MDAIAFWQMQLWAVNLITNSSIPHAKSPAGMFQSNYLILLLVTRSSEINSYCSPGHFHHENLPSYSCLSSKQGIIYNVSQQPVTLHFQNKRAKQNLYGQKGNIYKYNHCFITYQSNKTQLQHNCNDGVLISP
jgi:hypothetical protein